MSAQLLVLAKRPVPGRVKTRLCPPCTPTQAASIAAAAIDDTLAAVDHFDGRRILVADGAMDVRPEWTVVRQCTGELPMRLAHAFVSTARPGVASILIGMDTPQVTLDLLDHAGAALEHSDAALGPALDGGWWILALRDPYQAVALLDVPTSRDDTGARTLAALRRRGLTVSLLPHLRDVDTAGDALAIAADCPGGRFAAAVRAHLTASLSVPRQATAAPRPAAREAGAR